MSTRCKINPRKWRVERTFRRDVRRRLAGTFDYLMARGQVREALDVGRVLKRVLLLTNHSQFMRALNEESSPGPAIFPEGINAVASAV